MQSFPILFDPTPSLSLWQRTWFTSLWRGQRTIEKSCGT